MYDIVTRAASPALDGATSDVRGQGKQQQQNNNNKHKQ